MKKSKGCEVGEYGGEQYRVCYGLNENGGMNYQKKLYEFHKHCNCIHCRRRSTMDRLPANHLTVTTDDMNRFEEVISLIKKYSCESPVLKAREFVRLIDGMKTVEFHDF